MQKAMMATAVVMALVIGLTGSAMAEEPGAIRTSAVRLAAEAGAAQDMAMRTYRRSAARTAIGAGLIGAGIYLLVKQPEQPTLPGIVSENAFQDAAIERFNALGYLSTRILVGGVVLNCEPLCPGSIDRALRSSFDVGGAAMGVSAWNAIDESDWTLYQNSVMPAEEKPDGEIIGGAALIGAGFLISAFWADVPVDVRADRHGVTVGRTVGW